MEEKQQALASRNSEKEFIITGQLVEMRDRTTGRAPQPREQAESPEWRFLSPPEFFTIDEVARTPVDGVDTARVLNDMADMGPQARLLVYRPEGKVLRYQVFEDPRVCLELNRGAVIENLNEKPKDVSGWRTHDFFIDVKGCLGDECGRCAVVCPESAIHLMGKGKGSFHEIDPLACKGCFICWVECVRTAADCILVDGKTFDPGMRAKHFGE
jgi:Pyruvate/2-oxoacid:ferredoxin oxidoreductase delta subunit